MSDAKKLNKNSVQNTGFDRVMRLVSTEVWALDKFIERAYPTLKGLNLPDKHSFVFENEDERVSREFSLFLLCELSKIIDCPLWDGKPAKPSPNRRN